jgi:hypothetical protein
MDTISDTFKHKSLLKRGAFGAFAAGLALALSGLIQLVLVYPAEGPGELGSTSAYLIEFAHAVAWAGMILAFLGLRALHVQGFGRLGNISVLLGSIGNVSAILITIGILVTTALGAAEAAFAEGAIGETIANVMILPGFMTWLVLVPLLGIAAWRAKVVQGWCALLLIAHPLFMFSLIASYGFGGIAIGALWFSVGFAIRSHYQRQELLHAFGQQQIV